MSNCKLSVPRRRALRVFGLTSLATAVACVSPPRAVGPTSLAGAVPGAVSGASASAARAPGATDGPLFIHEPVFAWVHVSSTEATFEWACTVENPSQEGFRVTMIIRLVDAEGRPVKTTNQAFLIEGESMMPLRGEGLVEGIDADRVTEWRLEYWPQLLSRPLR